MTVKGPPKKAAQQCLNGWSSLHVRTLKLGPRATAYYASESDEPRAHKNHSARFRNGPQVHRGDGEVIEVVAGGLAEDNLGYVGPGLVKRADKHRSAWGEIANAAFSNGT